MSTPRYREGMRRHIVEAVDVSAPWSPTPLLHVRRVIADDSEMQVDIVFPTVYEEDRTVKIKDLAAAQGLDTISHRRMAEQIAKELGIESYDYDDERAQIQREQATVAKTPLGLADSFTGSLVGPDVQAAVDKAVNPPPQPRAPTGGASPLEWNASQGKGGAWDATPGGKPPEPQGKPSAQGVPSSPATPQRREPVSAPVRADLRSRG